MAYLVAAIGALNILLGLIGLLSPATLRGSATEFWNAKHGDLLAIAIRLLLSALLIVAAPYCRWPLAIQILGIMSFIAALVVAFLSYERKRRLHDWLLARSNVVIQSVASIGLLLGVFMVTAAGVF